MLLWPQYDNVRDISLRQEKVMYVNSTNCMSNFDAVSNYPDHYPYFNGINVTLNEIRNIETATFSRENRSRGLACPTVK